MPPRSAITTKISKAAGRSVTAEMLGLEVLPGGCVAIDPSEPWLREAALTTHQTVYEHGDQTFPGDPNCEGCPWWTVRSTAELGDPCEVAMRQVVVSYPGDAFIGVPLEVVLTAVITGLGRHEDSEDNGCMTLS
ncbi:hypothetical protein ABPG75_008330 [Micractinium tetrahymenae]